MSQDRTVASNKPVAAARGHGSAVPAIVVTAGDHGARRFLEFFATNVRYTGARLKPPSRSGSAVTSFARPASPFYLAAASALENVQAIAADESPRTTKLYDRTDEEITLDEVERPTISGSLALSVARETE